MRRLVAAGLAVLLSTPLMAEPCNDGAPGCHERLSDFDKATTLAASRSAASDVSDAPPAPAAPAGAATAPVPAPTPAPAGPRGVVLHMKDGQAFEGVFLSSDSKTVTIDLGSAEVGIDAKDIASIEFRATDLSKFLELKAKVDPTDPKANFALALWAKGKNLDTQAEEMAQAVLLLDPSFAGAHALLGHEFINGRWLEGDDILRAKGYVMYKGDWILRDDLDVKLRGEENDRANREDARREADAARVEDEAARAKVQNDALLKDLQYHYGTETGNRLFYEMTHGIHRGVGVSIAIPYRSH